MNLKHSDSTDLSTFERPFFATALYAIAIGGTVLSVLLGAAVGFGVKVLIPGFSVLGIGYGLVLAISGLLNGVFFGALGYAIEKLAEVARNTNPRRVGSVIERALASQPNAAGEFPKSFFIVADGKESSAMSAAEMMSLYRDGRLTVDTKVMVAERGHRRAMRDWTEIGL
jgi:hypothetical protein